MLNIRQKKAMETKRKILNTALRLFSERGFHNVTVDEIVKESSTSKGAFYTHFKSKHEVFLAKFNEIDDFYLEFIQNQEKNDSAYSCLLKFFYAQMTFIKEQMGEEVIRTIYINELNPDRESFFINPERPLYKIMRDFFRQGQKKGEFTNEISAEKMTLFVARSMRGLLYDWCIYRDNIDIVEESQTYLKVLLDGFKR